MTDSVSFRHHLFELQEGNLVAADQLIEHSYQRLQEMAGRMLRLFPSVRRWEDTDDVCLLSAVSFHRALSASPPVSIPHFFHLAGTQIRRTLIDLARKHNGPLGLNSNLDTRFGESVCRGEGHAPWAARESDCEVVGLMEWEEFHRDIESLPHDARQIFDLLWYGGLSQLEAADVLGVHCRSVKRRWRRARLLLYERRRGAAVPI